MKHTFFRLFSILCLLMSACSPSETNKDMASSPPSSPSSPLIVYFQPGHGVSGVYDSPLRVVFSKLGERVPMDVVEQAYSHVALYEWPSMTLVDTERSLRPSDEDELQRAFIDLHPKSPLTYGTYVLALSELPPGVDFASVENGVYLETYPGGLKGVRFYAHSAFEMLRAYFCQLDGSTNSEPQWYMRAELTEQIEATQNRVFSLTPAPTPCGIEPQDNISMGGEGALEYPCFEHPMDEALTITFT